MSDPLRLHADTLAALDRREEDAHKLLVEAQRVQILLQDPKLLGLFIPGWHSWPDVERLLTAELAGMGGRRRILERHAPYEFSVTAGPVWACRRCFSRLWPCVDWRDASAGLRVTDA